MERDRQSKSLDIKITCTLHQRNKNCTILGFIFTLKNKRS